ncbi:hypothetical protein BBJ28_00021090 [Nothophytophthora sp. Chile5]|nr:hypothetical protein BBJ28_00021090 [Nothophytophthora sp. Chile5]
MTFPGGSKGLCVLLAFQHEIDAFAAPADKRSLATASPWLQRAAQVRTRNCSTAGAPTAFPGDKELQTLTRRIHARLMDDYRRNGMTKGSKKKPRKRLTAVQVRLLLRDLLLVGSGLRASCLVDCCAMSTELAEFLLDCLALEDERWGRCYGVHNVRAVVLDGNVFFVNVAVFIREKMLELATEFRHLLYVDVSASLALPRVIRRDSDTAASALHLDSAAQWVLRACKGLLVALANPMRRVLAWRKPAMLNATAVAGLLLCYPCVYDIIADAAEGGEDLDSAWSDQENCLALCPLLVVQTAIMYVSAPYTCNSVTYPFCIDILAGKMHCTPTDAVVLARRPPKQTSMMLQEFSVPQHLLRFMEDEEQRYVAKKEGLLSSKLLRGLFGGGKARDNCLSSQGESFVAEKDYLYLLNYLEEFMPLPKQLYAAFEECMIPMAGLLSNAQFVEWVRQYPDVMEFIAVHLPPTPLPVSPLSAIQTSDEFLANSYASVRPPSMFNCLVQLLNGLCIISPALCCRDPLNSSPSCRNDGNKSGSNTFSSFDFIGGEDSGDDDSDELYDSDQISEMESANSSFRGNAASIDDHDELTTILKEAGAVVGSQSMDAAPMTSPMASVRDPFYPSEDSGAPSSRRGPRSGTSRSRGVHKMGRYMGKAVGGGISKVGHVGRSILHVGKSGQHNGAGAPGSGGLQTRPTDHHNEADPAAAVLLSAGYLFSSESRSTKNYVCGYLHKISDSKWAKRSWHRRWFVLDRQRGVLSYYRHNPANHGSASLHGNIVHMVGSPVPGSKDAAAPVNDGSLETKQQSLEPPASQPSAPSSTGDNSGTEGLNDAPEPPLEASEAVDPVSNTTTLEAWVAEAEAEPEKQQEQEPHQQTLLYLNKAHPWYRGALDLNMDNVSLLFEKTLAKNAPTRYFFQVSTLSLHDMDSKRGVQYKLCADTEADFDIWTSAIAESINRKDTLTRKDATTAPVLSHQQLYRQRLLQKQMQAEAAEHEHEAAREPESVEERGATASPALGSVSPVQNGADARQPSPSPSKRKIPPRIVTQFPTAPTSAPSCWHLHLSVDGTKQCLIVGFMLNIVAIRCLASEHVLWKLAVCLLVTCTFVVSVYHPRPAHRPHRGGLGAYVDANGTVFTAADVENALLDTDLSQCSDPETCCLHKLASGGAAGCLDRGEGDLDGVEGSNRPPRRRFSGAGNGRFVKFPMGSTMSRSEMQVSGRSSNVAHSWAPTRAETFSIRSCNYKRLRRKEASQPALFEFIGADFVRTDGKVDLISQRVEFPPEYASDRLFIINAQVQTSTLRLDTVSDRDRTNLMLLHGQLPSYGPSVWGDGICDGPGYSLVLYWKIPDAALENPTTTTMRLLKRFLEAGGDTSLTDRFKVIAQVTNQDECGITGMGKKLLTSHNATPVLTRPQHRIYHFRDGSTEMVVDIHAFSYIARRGIHLLLDKTTRLVIDVAFVIQGETDEELPEQVLGCCRLDRVDVQKAVGLP